MVKGVSEVPAVSVVIPNYNKATYIAQAIESVLRQTIADFELIVVDDSSTDGSVDIIRGFAKRDERVRLYQLPRKCGAGAARNFGIKKSKAEVVSLLDSDDLYSPSKLEKQLAVLNNIGEDSVVYCDWWRIDGEGRELPPFRRGHVKKSGNLFCDLIVQSLGINTNFMARKRLFEEVGLFDESLAYSEDHDFLLKLSKAHPFTYIDERLYGYRVHGGNSRNILPKQTVFYYKALVTARHLRESGSLLSAPQRRIVEKNLRWYYAVSGQKRKLLRMGLTSGEGLMELGSLLRVTMGK